MKNCLLIITTLCFIFTNCQTEKKQHEKDTKAIKQLLKEYEEAAANGEALAYSEFFSDDVIWAQPNAPVVKSKKQLLERIQPILENMSIKLNETTFEIIIKDDFAYAMSDVSGTFTLKKDGTVIPVSNTALRIFRKEKDAWKISRQIYNSNL